MPRYVVDQVLRARPHLGRQSSRLDEVLRAGQKVGSAPVTRTVDDPRYGKLPPDWVDSNDEPRAERFVSDLLDARRNKKERELADLAEQATELKAKEATAKGDQVKQMQLLLEQYMKDKNREDAENALNTWKRNMEDDYDVKITAAKKIAQRIRNEDLSNPEKLLSPSKVEEYVKMRRTSTTILTSAKEMKGLEKLPELVLDATTRIDENDAEIARMKVYRPKIKEALEDELVKHKAEWQDEMDQLRAQLVATEEARDMCRAIAESDVKADEATLSKAEDSYQALEKEAAEKAAAYDAAAAKAAAAEQARDARLAQLNEAKYNADQELQKFLKWESTHGMYYGAKREIRQEALERAKQAIPPLIQAHDQANTAFYKADVAVKVAYTAQEVANAKLEVAQQRVDHLKSSINTVVGKPV